jgi:sRNA-binding protein
LTANRLEHQDIIYNNVTKEESKERKNKGERKKKKKKKEEREEKERKSRKGSRRRRKTKNSRRGGIRAFYILSASAKGACWSQVSPSSLATNQGRAAFL